MIAVLPVKSKYRPTKAGRYLLGFMSYVLEIRLYWSVRSEVEHLGTEVCWWRAVVEG
jgi:hypothetical protein